MKLLLLETVAGLGDMGEVVEVRDGYGRNYLLPQRLAVANTVENRREIETLRLVQLQREADRVKMAEHAVKDLARALLQVRMKAMPDGSLYGSVNAAVVVDVIEKAKGYRIEERWIVLPDGPIKKIGDYDVSAKLPNEREVTFKLTVLPEGE
ncbi:MAG: 50S ribosomal protein L9 [Planctomycetota bacterium]